MDFKDLNLKISYTSQGNNKIVEDFLNPALSLAKCYRRSVGFFSSSAFLPIIDGIQKLTNLGGVIQIVASPKISKEDIHAIELGLKNKESVIQDQMNDDFKNAIEELNDEELKLLAELIARNALEIRIAVTKNLGAYHDKLGIIDDWNNNCIVFSGSSNETLYGLVENYEKVRLSKSWNESDLERIEDEIEEFQSVWENRNPSLNVYNYHESAKKGLLQICKHRGIKTNLEDEEQKEPIKLRDYQKKAIAAWKDNSYKGFYVMATGTGKTWTAIYSIKELKKEKDFVTVICAPYKHLIKQWYEDVKSVFPDSYIIMVSSENPSWRTEILNALYKKALLKNKDVIIISTIMSFASEKFEEVMSKEKFERLLIVDEAHRFNVKTDKVKKDYKYMLGLSATPYSGSSAERGKELLEYFGGQVFYLGIEEAIEKGYLVKYNYYPIFVTATDTEEEYFTYCSQQIATCYKNGKLIDKDKFQRYRRNRLRTIALSDEKYESLQNIITSMNVKDHFIVYCGDGKIQDEEGELRHISGVKKVLDECGYKPSQFTAKENMATRMALVESFTKGYIDALAAIRCLDEGINIPSIENALILASNDDYREFVQRRGRILRLFGEKKEANIYDVIVLPSSTLTGWAKIELRRFWEYAKLSINKEANRLKLEDLLEEYGLNFEDIDVYDYEELDDEHDE